MRLLLTLIFYSVSAYAQVDAGQGGLGPCTDLTPGFKDGGTFECSSLSLNGSLVFNPDPAVLIIKVTGDVAINGLVNLSGENGANNSSFSGSAGGDGGPGAGTGGGDDSAGNTLPGSDNSTASGNEASFGIVCGAGGGGAGLAVSGQQGTSCGDASSTEGAAGTAVSENDFSWSSNFRGGFGGGAGGPGSAFVYGSGGGGGGAIKIIAGGNIIIAPAGGIVANGGNGGIGGSDGGGGGAGSGGAIWLQALGQITNNGTMNANGGTGGTATAGGPGGNGGYGFIKIEDLDGVIDGTGTLPSYADVAIVSFPSTSALKSSISCGTVTKLNQTTYFQVMSGFMLTFMFSFLIKILFRFQPLFLKKTVLRN